MRVDELIEGRDDEVEEWKASKELCKSSRPNSSLGNSALASCKSQGYRRRTGSKKHRIGNKIQKVAGKVIKGKKYGGPL